MSGVERPDSELEKTPQWKPGDSAVNKNECQHCGGWVSDTFVRTYGRDGVVHACFECTDKTKLKYYAHGGDLPREFSDRLTTAGEYQRPGGGRA